MKEKCCRQIRHSLILGRNAKRLAKHIKSTNIQSTHQKHVYGLKTRLNKY